MRHNKQLIKQFHTYLAEPTSIAPLVTFRVIVGLLMFLGTLRFMWLGWIDDHFISPVFHFSYFGFSWIPVLSDKFIYLIHGTMLLSSLGVMLGLKYRFSIIILFLSFTYTQLIDLTYYLNHYYFVSLVLLLLIFAPAHRQFSLDTKFFKTLTSTLIPRFWIFIFQLMLAIVYVYAGLAKINAEWLIDAMPLRIWLPAADKIPLLGPVFAWYYSPWIFAWAGMLYDCLIVFFLMNRFTRFWAYISVLIFHTITGILFQIGIFPIVMIGATLIYFPHPFHKKLQGLFIKNIDPAHQHSSNLSSVHFFIFYLFFGLQILFPWRYLCYPGDLLWTEQGYRFSWRVMLMEKAGTAVFYVKDSQTGRVGVVDNREFLNAHQEKQMSFQPDMIWQFAQFLAHHYENQGVNAPQVRAEVYVTLNARPSTLLIDPYLDLTTVQDNWKNKNWILPSPRQ